MNNAYTSNNYTVYYFELNSDGLEKAIDIFSTMFYNPLFEMSHINKEINAINSENQKNLNQDNWRQYQLIKYLSNPEHPFNKFSTGNYKTLNAITSELLNKRLKDFFNKFYNTANMRLIISGRILK